MLDPPDPTSNEAVTRSTLANLGTILSILGHGVAATAIEPPVGAPELFDRIAVGEDGLEILYAQTGSAQSTGSCGRCGCASSAQLVTA